MKNIFKPILFSTPMVQAIQNDTKRQTRRTKGLESVNENPDVYEYKGYAIELKYSTSNADLKKYHFFSRESKEGNMNKVVSCPYTIGDILWVRETFYKPISEELNGKYFYKADLEKLGWNFKWKPSLFMPREACRIFLKVTNIRAERLMGMSKDDAVCEGVKIAYSSGKKVFFDGKICYELKGNTVTDNPIKAFKNIWENINGKDSWTKNPWVWVIEFEKVERPKDFL